MEWQTGIDGVTYENTPSLLSKQESSANMSAARMKREIQISNNNFPIVAIRIVYITKQYSFFVDHIDYFAPLPQEQVTFFLL